MSDKDVIIVGFPKSGNTWLARLLGDILDSPVIGWGSAHPIAEEGLNRMGGYVVRQLHLKPVRGNSDQFIQSAWEANLNAWFGERVIFVCRDPRDVVVSVKYYWGMESIESAIEAMGNGTHPLVGVGRWVDFIEAWRNVFSFPMSWIKYENLHARTEDELASLLKSIGLPEYVKNVHQAVQRQSFDNKRKQISEDGDTRPYGKSIQLTNLRKGIVGDWKNHHFTTTEMSLCKWYFEVVARKIGYGNDWDYHR